MKKVLVFISFIALSRLCMAQATTSPTIVLHGSYIATGSVSVNPFMEKAANPIDKSLHFRMKKGTKFYIEQQVDSQSTIKGYVVRVWNYNADDKTKKTFFGDMLTTYLARNIVPDNTDKQLSDKKAAIAKAVSDSLTLKLKADTLKTSLAIAKTMLSTASQKVLASGIAVDANKLISPRVLKNKKPIVTPELSGFVKAQSVLKADPSSPQLQNNFIAAITTLSTIPDESLSTSRQGYFAIKKQYDAIDTSLTSTLQKLKNKNEQLVSMRLDYTNNLGLVMAGASQQPDAAVSPDDYKQTKEQSGEKREVPGDPASPYGAFADFEYLDLWANGWTFFISAKDFGTNAATFYPTSFKFTWGFLTLPLKMRFDNSRPGGYYSFEQNLNFGLTVGFKQQLQRKDDVSWNYLAGLSVVNVPLNNATPAVNTITTTGTTTTTVGSTATSTAAASLSAGVMFQYTKFQIGVFVGLDFAGEHANQFAYQGKPWVGFAIGLSLFGEGQTTATAQTQK